jgi:hypothetical protein
MATLFHTQVSSVPSDRMAIFGKFARRFCVRRIERAQMRFAPTNRLSFRND